MDPMSAALYARWWQYETWLRELVYVELRSLLGAKWTDVVTDPRGRQARDAAFEHMSGPDNENPLAYWDYSQLVQLIGEYWDYIGYALLPRQAWDGRQHELTQIRHRIGHVRGSHPDDLNRLEQILRDLELGAFKALASYNRRFAPDSGDHDDPVTQGWIGRQHEVAQRLIDHADRNYEISILVEASRRPWATEPPVDLSGASGVLWHAEFILRSSSVDPARLWRYDRIAARRHLLVHMVAVDPYRVSFTYAAADDAAEIADAIGSAFDAVLEVSRTTDSETDDDEGWQRRARGIDFRVTSGSRWAIVDESTVPVTIFGSGGSVDECPSW